MVVFDELSSVQVKINGEWKQGDTLYAKMDGAWVIVYMSPKIIQYVNYPYRIPTMAGWQYSWDGVEWVDITYNMDLNTIGYTFTGYVKVKSELELNARDIKTKGLRFDGAALIHPREYSTSVVSGDKGYVCGGRVGMTYYMDLVDVYDKHGTRTNGDKLSRARALMCSFHDPENDKGYVCGGAIYDDSQWIAYPTVDIYDSNGIRSTGTSLSVSRYLSSSVHEYYGGYVFGGKTSSANSDVVDFYDIWGGTTTLPPMTSARYYTCAFGLDASPNTYQSAYVYGGVTPSGVKSKVGEKYNVANGTMTSSTYMSIGRSNLTAISFRNYVMLCGGETDDGITSLVEKLDNEDILTTLGNMSSPRANATSFMMGGRAYICGGTDGTSALDVVDVYDENGVMTIGINLSLSREALTSFVLDDKGFVCGGISGSSHRPTVDIYKDTNAIPVTAGSEYNLNGMVGTSDTSGTIFIDEPVTGTVKYKEGTI